MISKVITITFVIVAGLLVSGCGKQGDQGPAGPVGYPGANGDKGERGTDGVDGSDGEDGTDGLPGADGSMVNAIKFCEGVHNSSFPEYGLCIANKVYAVYWSGETSFLAYLKPGNYKTTSTGANCNFTVTGNNCKIVMH